MNKANRENRASTEAKIDKELAHRLPLRILVAEDNEMNQKVALLMLKRLGYRADVAANGLEALESLRWQAYDIVLMDIQMPEMDGLEAAREIRRLWPVHGPRIIAMTANATYGGRERCLAAGMNDYINKPVKMEALQDALERCGDKILEQASESSDLIDLEILATLRELSGDEDPDFLTTLIKTFFNDTASRLNELTEAVALRDLEMLRRAAHTLRGSSANVGARYMAELCQELEQKGESGLMQEAAVLLNELSVASHRTQRALEKEMSVTILSSTHEG